MREDHLLGGSGEVTWPFQLQSKPFGVMLLYKRQCPSKEKTVGYNLAFTEDEG